jgi:hypothetical protein
LKSIKPSTINETLGRLEDIGLIRLYEVDDRPYLKVLKWSDHQRVRVSKHKYPEPTAEQLAASCGNLRRVAANGGKLRPESNPIQSNPNPYPNPNTNPNPNPNPSPWRKESAKTDSIDFDVFWEAYPRKESKPAAKKAFDKIHPDEQLMQKIITSIRAWKESAQWKENGGQFIPYPASWLNQQKWNDVPTAQTPAPAKQYQQKKVIAQDFAQRDYSGVDEEYKTSLNSEIARFLATGEVDM